MNRALADIEQGRPAPAKHVLTTIERQEQAHPALRYIALGYLGLAEHLSGSLEPAIAKYDDAVKGLQQLGRSRAASIFARHKGDAERWRNIADSSAAESALTQAILLAQEGGHADVAHFARLAKIRLNVTKPGELHVAALSETVKQLDAIHTYATVIGLPRLRCEVLAVRARLLFTQGDARHAARIAAESLEIATQYDMRLRKVHALNLLAEIMHMSGQIQECRILLERSATLSNTYGYHHALEWINGRLSLVRAEAR
jgi:ATP/maltotriose-dependent transcriptional regulator MalT